MRHARISPTREHASHVPDDHGRRRAVRWVFQLPRSLRTTFCIQQVVSNDLLDGDVASMTHSAGSCTAEDAVVLDGFTPTSRSAARAARRETGGCDVGRPSHAITTAYSRTRTKQRWCYVGKTRGEPVAYRPSSV